MGSIIILLHLKIEFLFALLLNLFEMSADSRIKKTFLNVRIDLIFYLLTLILSFFSRSIFIDKLGDNFVGLTGSIQNLLSFLNLAELGIGNAIGYVLYTPIFNDDKKKINELISVFGYLYCWVGRIILIAGTILAGFLFLIFPNTQFNFYIIYFFYFSLLFSVLIGYFANYKQVLLGADQKNFMITAYFQSVNITKTLTQIFILYITSNYYIWISIELIFGIIYSIILNRRINKIYPWLNSEINKGRELFYVYLEVMKYTKQLFIHKISFFVQYQTTPFLIYSFVSLKVVAYFGNYTIITDKLSILINHVLGNVSASIGNLIAEGNKQKIIQVFWELIAIRFYICGFVVYCIYHSIEPFIVLWLGKEYLLASSILNMLIVRFFMQITRGVTDQFLYGYGLFYDTWAPIAESVIFLLIAIIGGFYYGITGILSGGIFSLFIIVHVWKPYFLFSKGFKCSIFSYWINWFKYLLAMSISFIISRYFNQLLIKIDPSNSYLNWSLYSLFIALIFGVIYFVLLYIVSPGMRTFIKRIIK